MDAKMAVRQRAVWTALARREQQQATSRNSLTSQAETRNSQPDLIALAAPIRVWLRCCVLGTDRHMGVERRQRTFGEESGRVGRFAVRCAGHCVALYGLLHGLLHPTKAVCGDRMTELADSTERSSSAVTQGFQVEPAPAPQQEAGSSKQRNAKKLTSQFVSDQRVRVLLRLPQIDAGSGSRCSLLLAVACRISGFLFATRSVQNNPPVSCRFRVEFTIKSTL